MSIVTSRPYRRVVSDEDGERLGPESPLVAGQRTPLLRHRPLSLKQECWPPGDASLILVELFAKLDPTQGGTAQPGNVYYDNGVANVPEPIGGLNGNADNLNAAIRNDVLNGNLPQVSWVVNNQFFSEHPVTAPGNGAYFLRGLLDALNADPDVFNSTLVIVNYDENDGQFDHVPPPIPAPGEVDEFVTGTLSQFGVTAPVPNGLGFRVPLILVSPWTRGGWVTSEVSDHTSVLQLLELWTTAIGKPAMCPQISPWRRQVCGDLTRAFDFANPVYGLPSLPDTGALIPEVRYTPLPGDNAMPTQESGTKPARPLPFQPNANLVGFSTAGGSTRAEFELSNVAAFAKKASHFSVYNNRSGVPLLSAYPAAFPGQYTVPTGQTISGTAAVGGSAGDTAYDITVVGPNRFLRRYIGDSAGPGANASVAADFYDGNSSARPKLKLWLRNGGAAPVTFTVQSNQYVTLSPQHVKVAAGSKEAWVLDALSSSGGWYDVTVTVSSDADWSQRLVGHLETGDPSISG
jgi:phospholipase C